jgi:hypothetical protein
VLEPYQLEGSDKTGNPGVLHQTAEWHGMFEAEIWSRTIGIIDGNYSREGKICGRCSRNRDERLLE